MAQYAPPTPGQPAYPQQPAPAGYAPVAPAPAPKKKSGCWIGCGVGCLILALLTCALAAGAYFGLLSMGKPKDLGVTYTEDDYWSAVEKAGTVWPPAPDGGEDFANTDVVYSGSKPLDATFSNSEISALLSNSHTPGWPIHDMQIRVSDGGGVELSGLVEYEGNQVPVYVDGSASIEGRTVSGSIDSAQAFGVAVPAEYLPQATEYGLGLVNDRLARMEGLDITSMDVTDGQLHLTGTVPAEAQRVPK
ncbi:MAG: hypothetical protein FDZ70_05945 [Actinobacteria bacterium]|nr:MAG: hypothetical protein FDZ70_05945 [Actinomycetota bacterium]